MNYNKFLPFLLFNFSLVGVLHAGMQDRIYKEVLIGNVTHPSSNSEDDYQNISVGPDGRIYLVYQSYNIYDSATGGSTRQDGWVEVYSPEGTLLATIDRSDISFFADNNATFMPYNTVLPGPGGIFTIYESNNYQYIVFDSNFQEYRTINGNFDSYYGWTRSLDGGFVTIRNNIEIRDGNGTIIGTESYNSDGNEYLFSLNGYTLTTRRSSVYYESLYDADGVLQSRNVSDRIISEYSPESYDTYYHVIDHPYIDNGQVLVPRRAYRTKGDSNAIPVPSIVSVAQVPDTTLIDITYRVDDADDATVTTGILASMTDGQGKTTRIPLATLAGGTEANLGVAVATNTDFTVTWDAGVDWGAAFGDVSFDVYANDGRPVLGFHMLTLPLPSGDLTISRSPVNDLEIKEALYYLWATGQGIRLADGQLVGQGGLFEGVLLGTPEAPVTDTSRAMLFYQLGLEEATEAQVNAARKSFDADTVYTFAPKNPIVGDLLNNNSLPRSVNELGFDTKYSNSVSYNTSNSESWVVPAATIQAIGGGAAAYTGGEVSFTVLDPEDEGWSISNLPDWLSTSDPTSGVGDTRITLSATENMNISYRSATVDINGGALSIAVNQNGSIFPDDFADRYALTGNSGSFTISNVGASMESGEPTPAGYNGYKYGNSLWFTFTAPDSGGYFSISARQPGGNYSPYVVVYTGDDLSSLSSSSYYPSSGIDLYANAGQSYHFAIITRKTDYGGSPGLIDISYQFSTY